MVDWTIKKIIFLCMWVVVYFAPIYEYLVVVGVLVFADTVSGAFAAKKRKEFSSRDFRRVVWKSSWYLFAIGIAHMIEMTFEIDLILKICAGYISFTELVSIDENYYKVTGKHLFKVLIDKLKQ